VGGLRKDAGAREWMRRKKRTVANRRSTVGTRIVEELAVVEFIAQVAGCWEVPVGRLSNFESREGESVAGIGCS